MKLILSFIAAFALAACDVPPAQPEKPQPKYDYDPATRRAVFLACLKATPAGPQSTKYNDWAEVVEECGTQAYRQSYYCYANCPPPPAEVKP